MRPVGIIKVEAFDRIAGALWHLGICNRRRVVKHFNNAFRVASDFPRIKRAHANSDFNRRHFCKSSDESLRFRFFDGSGVLWVRIRLYLIANSHAMTCNKG